MHPGDSRPRQPIHVFYGGAQLFKADVARKLGSLAQRALAEHAPNPATLAAATGIPETLADAIYTLIVEKLRREPIEDLRIDFEDGFGIRSDNEEDATADSAALEVAKGFAGSSLPPFLGIRIKPLNENMKRRAVRTLERFMSALLDRTGGELPRNFVVTLPKITAPDQIEALIQALAPFGNPQIEIMIETPQSLFLLPRLVEAAQGRCVAAHFGVYDYTASLGITASNQDMLHPACTFARSMILATLAGTGVRLSDGATNLLPLGDRASVHRAWKTHAAHIRNSMVNGFFQSWDLHPAQLVSRYAAVYAFFLEEIDASTARLRNFVAQAEQATQTGGVFDDAATGQALLNFFHRAIDCGAISTNVLDEIIEGKVPA